MRTSRLDPTRRPVEVLFSEPLLDAIWWMRKVVSTQIQSGVEERTVIPIGSHEESCSERIQVVHGRTDMSVGGSHQLSDSDICMGWCEY